MELPDRLAVVHGVERRDLVDAHGWHFEDAPHFIHDADRGISELALAEVEEGHHGRFLVLWGVAFKDLGEEGFVLRGEFEGYRRVVLGCVAVLWTFC